MLYANGIIYVQRGEMQVPMRAENLLYAEASGKNSVEICFWDKERNDIDLLYECFPGAAGQAAREMKKLFPGRLLESRYIGSTVMWPLDKLDWDRIFPKENKTRIGCHDSDYYRLIEVFFKGVTLDEPLRVVNIVERKEYVLLGKLLDEFYKVRKRVRKVKNSEFIDVDLMAVEPGNPWVTLVTCAGERHVLRRDFENTEIRGLLEKEFKAAIKTTAGSEIRVRRTSIVMPGTSFLRRSGDFVLHMRNESLTSANYPLRLKRSNIESCNLAELITAGDVVPYTDPDMIEMPNGEIIFVSEIKYAVMQGNAKGEVTQTALYLTGGRVYYLRPEEAEPFLDSFKDEFIRLPEACSSYWVSRKHLHAGLTAQPVYIGSAVRHKVFLRDGEALGVYLTEDGYIEFKKRLEADA